MNLILLAVLLLGTCLAAALTYSVELRRANAEIEENARLLIRLVTATRNYTVQDVRPLLQAFDHGRFLPQTVPSYAAQQTFRLFQGDFSEFTYREAALNPTNRGDLANGLEVDVINRFRAEPDLDHVSGEFADGKDMFHFLAMPLRVTDPACLSCHSTPEAAPPEMIAQYGSQNGFGWTLDETIGAQIITVPATLAYRRASSSTMTLLVSMISVFACIMIVINLFLNRAFFAPLQRLTEAAERFTGGDLRKPDLSGSRRDEIGKLERSLLMAWRSFTALVGRSEGRPERSRENQS